METFTSETAALAMHEGSRALMWAAGEGIISDSEYDQAELHFDIAQNRVYGAAGVVAVA